MMARPQNTFTSRRWLRVVVSATLIVAGATTLAQAQDLSDIYPPGLSISPDGSLRVIVPGTPEEIEQLARRYGIEIKRQLSSGGALEVTRAQLEALSQDSAVGQIAADAVVEATMAVSTTAIGADQLWSGLDGMGGTTGIGVGIAIVDSGIGSHPDLQDRVVVSVDFVEADGDGNDGYGHGTHVAGIAAGGGAAAGVAPAAHLINLRVLNDEGWGHASTVIEAIDWAIANQDRYAIRVLNLSLGAGVATSYQDDPLGQAVERAVAAGIVVVCSAGNYGKTEEGTPIIGGITSPGNTPSALTVGALNTLDTPVRSDDAVTSYSSRGPTAFDYVLKPDLVAPGNKVVSLEAPLSYLSATYPERQVPGGYLQLSGTSMSAAMVSGAAALLLGSNPDLSPQQVKIALQATASPIAGAGLVEAGAGSVNVVAALYVAVHGPTAELPTISIGGEPVDIGGLVFFSRLAACGESRSTRFYWQGIDRIERGPDTVAHGIGHPANLRCGSQALRRVAGAAGFGPGRHNDSGASPIELLCETGHRIIRRSRLIDVETHRAVFTWVQQRLVAAGLLQGRTVRSTPPPWKPTPPCDAVRRDTGEDYQAYLTRPPHSQKRSTASGRRGPPIRTGGVPVILTPRSRR